jgi:hypothetical protein
LVLLWILDRISQVPENYKSTKFFTSDRLDLDFFH